MKVSAREQRREIAATTLNPGDVRKRLHGALIDAGVSGGRLDPDGDADRGACDEHGTKRGRACVFSLDANSASIGNNIPFLFNWTSIRASKLSSRASGGGGARWGRKEETNPHQKNHFRP